MNSVPTAHGFVPQNSCWTGPPCGRGVHLAGQTTRDQGAPLKHNKINDLPVLTGISQASVSGKVYLRPERLCRNRSAYRSGTTVISRSAAMRSSSGGCVLKSEESVSEPNMGLTMHSAEVVGDSAVVGMRLL